MNEEGKVYMADPEGADEETIQRAIEQCPSRVISMGGRRIDPHTVSFLVSSGSIATGKP
jgi:hypothetical protein